MATVFLNIAVFIVVFIATHLYPKNCSVFFFIVIGAKFKCLCQSCDRKPLKGQHLVTLGRFTWNLPQQLIAYCFFENKTYVLTLPIKKLVMPLDDGQLKMI